MNIRKNKKGNKGITMLIVLVLVVALGVALAPTFSNFLGGISGGTLATVGQLTIPTERGDTCLNIDTVTLSMSSVQKGKSGTTMPDNAARVWINGQMESTRVVDGGTSSLSVGDAYTILFNENSTAASDVNAYTALVSGVTPCKDQHRETAIEAGAIDITPTLYIRYDGDKISDTSDIAMGASTTYEVEVCLQASSNEWFGNPELSGAYSNVVVAQVDKTFIQEIDSSTKGASVPRNHTFANTTWDGTYAFEFPIVGDGKTACESFTIETTSTAPGEDDANVLFTFYDIDRYVDEDDSQIYVGVEDMNGQDLSYISNTAVLNATAWSS